MWKILLFLILKVTISFVTGGYGNSIIGPGKWKFLNMMQCEDQDQYEMIFEISRQKLNRTHDCFSAHINSDRAIDDSCSAELIMYQKVDGGFKLHSKIEDNNACSFMKKFIGDNMQRGLKMAGVDPPDCPIPAGDVILKDFVFDYRDMPEKGIYGIYEIKLYLSYLGERMSCLGILASFDDASSDEECEE